MREIFIDFETRSACDLKISGVDKYAAHPTTDVWCMAYAMDDGPVYLWKEGEAFPQGLRHAMEGDYTIIAHNVGFEAAIWLNVMTPKHGWPKFDYRRAHCTMAEAYAMSLPGSLEKVALALGLETQKDMRGSRIAVQVSKPRALNEDGSPVWWDAPEKFEILYSYCRTDVEVQREIYRRTMRLSARERKVWEFDFELNRRGVRVDMEALKKAHEIVEFERERLDLRMREVTDNAVSTCNAVSQIAAFLKERGVETDGVAKGDVKELLTRDLPEDVRTVLTLRQEAAKSSTAKLIAMINRAGDDGRMRGLFQYHGANTGRWAGRGPQLQNFPRIESDKKDMEQVFEILKS